MTIDDLYNGKSVIARWGRAGEEAPNWGTWQPAALTVQKHQGKVCGLTLRDHNWAEYGPDDLCDDGLLLAEDYYLQIEGLE